MRFFNTTGPVKCEIHYCLPPLTRFDLDEILSLIDQEKYFILHAPRQVGKTSYLLALMDYLNRQSQYHCLYFNVESAQAAREDVQEGARAILGEMAAMAQDFLGDPFPEEVWEDVLRKRGPYTALTQVFTLWAKASSKPLVLLIDEIDSLVGDTLIAVLRQLRTGYTKRPRLFPQSIVLCGVRDVRDYRIYSSREKAIITGGVQKTVIEMKVLYRSLERTVSEGLAQTWAYLDRCGVAEGHLVIFDRTEDRPWGEKLFRRSETYQGTPITVWGM